MKAILIDPWKRSIETINVQSGADQAAMQQLYELVGEEGLDFYILMEGECVVVGDHSALHKPPWPHFQIGRETFYGRAVVLGFDRAGKDRETRLSVDDISNVIIW